MHKHDDVRLRHMLDAAREAQSFARGNTRESLDTDRKLSLALVRDIEIIGEAAARLSDAFPSEFAANPLARHHRHEKSADPRVLRHQS